MKPTSFSLLCLLFLSVNIGHADAFDNSKICYTLDAILFTYGLILTILYCRMRIMNELAKNNSSSKAEAQEGVYEGLSQQTQDTYESIGMKGTKS